MVAEMDGEDKRATTSTIAHIEQDEHIFKLVHGMLHTCYTVDEYIEKLEGLIRVFWGDATPDGRILDEVKWMEVMVQLLPTDCLVPIFEESILQRDGKARNINLWDNIHKEDKDEEESETT